MERPTVFQQPMAEAIPGNSTLEDVVNVVLFLGLSLASCVTGITLPVDGGFLARP